MLIFIQNSPRAYAWGSTHALPEILEHEPTGEPQAELWLGDHVNDPADVAGVMTSPLTLIDLIHQQPDVYGVDGGHLPFMMKILGIGAPLSLQVHPNSQQAKVGFAREERAGVPLDDPTRSYPDARHKPELLVALSRVEALCGFRPLTEALHDLDALAAASGTPLLKRLASRVREVAQSPATEPAQAPAPEQQEPPRQQEPPSEAAARRVFFHELFELAGVGEAREASRAVAAALDTVLGTGAAGIDPERVRITREIATAHPGDPGLIVSLLCHHVTLEPGEALFVEAGQLHAYLGGVGVEVMASSDNVLRAGLTEKHVNVPGLLEILDLDTAPRPGGSAAPEPGVVTEHGVVTERGVAPEPGAALAGGHPLTRWQPPVTDFQLARVRLGADADSEFADEHTPEVVQLDADYPLVMITTHGLLRIERPGSDLREVASVKKGHSLYISAGASIEISGAGEAFIATVGPGFSETF